MNDQPHDDYAWLDAIIAEQAKLKGLTVEQAAAQERDTAIAQELIEREAE